MMSAFLHARAADIQLLLPAAAVLEVGLWEKARHGGETLWREQSVPVLDLARALQRNAETAAHFIVIAGDGSAGAEENTPMMLLVTELIGLLPLDTASFQPVVDRGSWPTALVGDACLLADSGEIALRLDLAALRSSIAPEATTG